MPSKLSLLIAGRFEEFGSATQKEIYKEFYELVYGIIFYMVKDHASTEDIIQESFLKVVRQMPPMDHDGKLKAWLRTVVKNMVYNYLRKNKNRRNEIDVDSVLLNSDIEIASSSEWVEKEIELKMMSEKVGECLRDLKPEYQALIELRWKRELSYKEMADVLGTTEETVKHKLHRAREAMKKRFVKAWGEPTDARRIR